MGETTASAGEVDFAESAAGSRSDKSMLVVTAAILVVVVLILIVVFYGLVAGVINPPAPRTAQEFALVRAQAMVKSTPQNGQYWSDYIDVLVAQEEFAEAAKIVSSARKAVGENDSIFIVDNAELRLLIAQEQHKKALDSADKYLEQEAKSLEKMMSDYRARGITVPDTIDQQRTAVTVDTLGYKAIAAIGLKKYDVALDALTTALEASPLAADVAAFRGQVYIMKGDKESLEKARTDFTYALQFIPDYPVALEGLAEVEKLTGVKTPPLTQ